MELIQNWINTSKNKKGISTLEIVIGMLIFLIAFCFLMDLLILIWKYNVIGQATTHVARLTSIQGGALNSPPSGYPGGYMTIKGLNSMIQEKFDSAGISSTEWEAKIGSGRIGRSGIYEAKHDYKESFPIEFTVDYRWDFMSNILPGNLKQTIKSKRIATSEWKYIYNNWNE